MSQSLAIFSKAGMPAHLTETFGDEANIRDRQTTPTLSFEGKVWQIALNGERTKITRRNADGDEEPTQIMRVVVLGVADRRGRTLYEGAYDPAKPGAPLCWSDDGFAPDKSVSEPKSVKCDTCPLSAKGSKVTEQGKAISACSQHLMLAVVPHNQLEFTPLRMKLAITSVWDKQSPDLEKQNWYAFDNYREFLRANGVKHTAMLVTKMKFDPNVPYPKVVFSPDRWLEAHEAETVKPILTDVSVTSLLGGHWTPAGADGKPVISTPVVAPVKAATPAVDDEDEVVIPPVKAAKPAKPVKAKAPVVDEDDEDSGTIVLTPTKPAAPKAAPRVTTEVSEDLDELLQGWDDNE